MGLCSGLLVENVEQHHTNAQRYLRAIPANPHAGLTARSENITTLNRMVPEGQKVPQGQTSGEIISDIAKSSPMSYIHVDKFGGGDGDVFESGCSSL